MPSDPHLSIVVLEDKEVDGQIKFLEDTYPTKPFEFVRCTFKASPKFPLNPCHGHPALIFNHCTFKGPLKLNDQKFHRELTFRECRFESYVDFTKSHFLCGVSFEDCSFNEKVYFEEAIFGVIFALAPQRTSLLKLVVSESTNLRICEYYLKMILEPLVNPSKLCPGSLKNSSKLQKHSHELEGCANFHAAVFNDGAEFDYATFHVPACFYKTTWYEAATFLQCQFPFVKRKTSDADIINFSYAQIAGSVEFNQSLRPSKERPDTQPYDDGEVSEECIHVNFKYIHVHKPHGLRFHTENLTCCSVLGTNLDACHFSNVRWPKVETHYPLALRESCTFLRIVLQNYRRQRTWAEPAVISVVKHFIVCICSGISYWTQFGVSLIVRLATRWMVPHRLDDQSSNPSQTFLERVREAFAKYWASCKTLKQYCICDHRIQNEEQEKALKSCRSFKSVAELEKVVPRWRDQWALLPERIAILRLPMKGTRIIYTLVTFTMPRRNSAALTMKYHGRFESSSNYIGSSVDTVSEF